MPKVSVIIPVYNVEKYLPKCIDSVLCQTFSDIEIILVDDGATDGSSKICLDYAKRDERIKVIVQENGGLGAARNTGVNHAVGEYLFFLDSDDTIKRNTFEVLVEKAEQFDADIVIFDFDVINEQGKHLWVEKGCVPNETCFSIQVVPELLFKTPSACNKFWRRSFFVQTQILFPPRVWFEDLRTIPKFYIQTKKITYVDTSFYCYLRRDGSIMKNKNVERNSEIMDATTEIIEYYKEKDCYEKYEAELEFMVLLDVMLGASMRVLGNDKKSNLLPKFKEYMEMHFPNYMQNKYLGLLLKHQTIGLKLLNKKQYFMLSIMSKVKKLKDG